MRIACAGYRQWALGIYDDLAAGTDHQILIFRSQAQYDEGVLRDFRPDIVLFYGWSWVVDTVLIRDYRCVMLHPSPLPKYRGGSPIQNQIIAGETSSAVTLFLMDEGIDSGPILAQHPLSLEGSLQDIFARIRVIGRDLTAQLLSSPWTPVEQRADEATVCRRRKPSESEITTAEIREKPAAYLFNKIRMLQAPYPNAYIRTADGKRLAVLDARVEVDD